MYTAAGEYTKAVEIMGENGWIDKLVLINASVVQRILFHQTSRYNPPTGLISQGNTAPVCRLVEETWTGDFTLCTRYIGHSVVGGAHLFHSTCKQP